MGHFLQNEPQTAQLWKALALNRTITGVICLTHVHFRLLLATNDLVTTLGISILAAILLLSVLPLTTVPLNLAFPASSIICCAGSWQNLLRVGENHFPLLIFFARSLATKISTYAAPSRAAKGRPTNSRLAEPTAKWVVVQATLAILRRRCGHVNIHGTIL